MSWPDRIVVDPEVLAGKPVIRGSRLAVEFILDLLEFRGEFFNMLNRVRFGDPGLAFGNPQFGVITSQTNSPRKVQFGLKLLY